MTQIGADATATDRGGHIEKVDIKFMPPISTVNGSKNEGL
jgi:hypothetical protein